MVLTMTATYDWQRYYEAAILETDRLRLPKWVKSAQAAIDARIEELRSDHQSTADEQAALADALAGLRLLRNGRTKIMRPPSRAIARN